MNTSANITANPNNFVVPSFINASYSAGRLSVGVYHMAERTTTEAVNFANAANALNYAFLLKKRHGITIARRAFDLILWEIKRTGAVSTRAKARAEAKARAAEPQPEPQPEPKAEPEQEAKPKKAAKAPSRKSHSLEKQFEEMKKKHPDAVLLFRVGDFYECLGEDAVAASDILGITLTRRASGKSKSIEVAGFPHHALDTYLPKLVRAGRRVAICEQLEEPKPKAAAK